MHVTARLLLNLLAGFTIEWFPVVLSLFRNVCVFGSLVIRTAVNLSLIVVLTVQPVSVWMGAGRCDANAPADTACGCCAATAVQRICGCCEKRPPKRAETAESCCQRSAEVVLAEHSSEQVKATCGCGFQSHPIGETSGSRVSLLLRDAMTLVLTTLSVDDVRGGQWTGRGGDLRSAAARPSHFAQIQYGNWRL
jgi:hypothetical protein